MNTQERPRDHQSEHIVCIGLLTLGGPAVAEVSAVLRPDDLDHPAWRAVFNAAIAAERAGQPVDIGTVQAHIKAADEQNRINMSLGPNALHEAARARVNLDQVRYHAQNVAAHAARRRLIGGIDKLRDMAFDCAEMDALTAEALKVLRDAQVRTGVQRHRVSTLARGAIQRYDGRTGGREITGIRTGIALLDAMTGGLQPGHLIILGAPTSGGKSALATQIMVAADAHVLAFSLEMNKEELADRMIVQEARVDGFRFQGGRLTLEESIAAHGAAARVAAGQIEVAEGDAFDVETIRIEILRWLASIGNPARALVLVDYLQLVELRSAARKGREAPNREQEVSTIARVLKQTAEETDSTILALSQLNDDGRTRESKAVEHHGNEVFILEPEADDAVLLRIRKQRNGPKAALRLRWIAPSMRFEQHPDQLIAKRKRRAGK